MAENQTRPTKASVAAFIAAIGDETRRADAKVLAKLLGEVSGEKAVMWGPAIVGFGSHHYKYESGREGDMPILAFSPRAGGNVVYFPKSMEALTALFPKLGKHKVSGGCLHIKRLADVDMAVLKSFVTKIEKAGRAKAMPKR